jgi:hypothetical protein
MVSVLDARPTMLPPEELLTDVLPTDRLTVTGMPVPELRVELRKIDDLRTSDRDRHAGERSARSAP